MNEKHLNYFKVENFKRFESFEMNNIGQFNLILGDNNVGKTSVLEALLFDLEDANRFRDNLLTVLYEFRKVETDTENPLRLFLREFTDNEQKFMLEVSNNKRYVIDISTTINGKTDSYIAKFEPFNIYIGNKNSYSAEIAKQNIPYIPFHLGYDNDLVYFYNKFIEPFGNIEKRLIEALKNMLPTISTLKLAITDGNTPFLRIAQTDKDERIPLSMFGEGTIKLFRILMKIVVHRGKRLMIDEIDAGVHFKKFKNFWRTILLAAKQNEVQIFATTHNLECLQAFKEVLEEIEMLDFQEDARSFTLRELPNGQVKAYTYPYEQFKAMLENENNIRGGSYEK
jgi:AAA15 family ATPase/GTPase